MLGGLAATPFGLVDYLAIPAGTRAKRVGRLHGIMGMTVMLMFCVSWYLRMPDPTTPGLAAVILSFGGATLAGFTGWLGGELVNRMGVGVAPDANLDAPSSLRSIATETPAQRSRIA